MFEEEKIMKKKMPKKKTNRLEPQWRFNTKSIEKEEDFDEMRLEKEKQMGKGKMTLCSTAGVKN